MLFHLHIPRTGGKSVVKRLWQTMPSPGAVYHFSSYQTFWDDVLARNPGNRFDAIKVVTGHYYYGIHEYFNEQNTYLVVLRNPIDRIKSVIRYVAQNRHHRLHHAFSSAQDISDIYANIHLSPQLCNGQVRQLCRYDWAALIDLRERHFDQALKNLHDESTVSLTTESLSKLSAVAAHTAEGAKMFHENRSSHDLFPWLDTEAASEIIHENNLLDMRLYESVKRAESKKLTLFEAQLRSVA